VRQKSIGRKLTGIRPFIDRFVELKSVDNIMENIISSLPNQEILKDAIVRLSVQYPREWDTLIDEAAMRRFAGQAFEFHLVKRPQIEARIRLPAGQGVSNLVP